MLMKMEVFFILWKRSLLQISFVSGVKAQHTARKSDCFASSSIETRLRERHSDIITWHDRKRLSENSHLKKCHSLIFIVFKHFINIFD